MLLTNCSTYTASFKGQALEKSRNGNEHGFTKERLENLTNYLEDHMETTGMVVLFDGKIIYEYGDIAQVSYNASVRKSVLSMLYGKYVENGVIDLRTTLQEMGIDDVDSLLAIEKTATIHDIISARSGVFHLPVNGGYDEKNVLKRGAVKPGEYFLYNNWDYNVAGYILEKYAEKSIYEELEEQLARPLGFQDWNIKNQEKMYDDDKSFYPAYHMYMSTRDHAKIGQLMLNNGKWNGKQLISKSWIEKTLTAYTPKDTVNKRYGLTESSSIQQAYGYMWWLFKTFKNNPDFEGAYTARGWGGQFLTIIPKRKLVIAHMTAVSTLVKIGWLNGGVSDDDYWNILDKLMTGRIFLEELTETMETNALIELIRSNKTNSTYDFSESVINSFGYRLLNDGSVKEAIDVFQLNIEMYPTEFNTYDSYGEALMTIGKTSEAIAAFEKSLELNPLNTNARNQISKLKRNY
jgi:CubicO group peptidase (beta-lactamase class C family)